MKSTLPAIAGRAQQSKAALSLWAVVKNLCVLAFFALFFAACSDDSSNKSDDSSSSVAYSAPSEITDPTHTIAINDFSITDELESVSLSGTVDAAKGKHITSLTFIPANLVTWIGEGGQTSWDSISGPNSITLTGKATINKTDPSLACGNHDITVKACVGAACESKNGKFTKAASFCASSSSVASSSSAAVWTFGEKNNLNVKQNIETKIGNATFKLAEGKDSDGGNAVVITLTNGEIRETGLVWLDDNGDQTSGGPIAGKEYPDSQFGNSQPISQTALTSNTFYVIIAGSEKFLVWFKTSPVTQWGTEGKPVQYWEVTTSP